jgi:hypothetical protein
MRHMKIVLSAAVLSVALLGYAMPAAAQGCILLRQTAPAFGTVGYPDQEVGVWSLAFTGRSSTADHHYNGTTYQAQRQLLNTYVVNQQNSITMTVSYQAKARLSLNVGVPFVQASWGIPSPQSAGEAARANENTRGLGDITSLARFGVLSRAEIHSWNIMVGGGLKFPTGHNNSSDVFPASNGTANLARYTDISTQPGDGGWGIISDVQGFKEIKRVMLYASGTYLMSPKDTGAPVRGTLVTTDTSTLTSLSSYNTVSDQFVVRAGGQAALFHGVGVSMSWRVEGVPRYDVIGRSDGFRRPGREMYWEPGITWTAGRHTISFNLPVGYYFNRTANPYTGNSGDSTFPKYVAIATYSARLGKGAHMIDHNGPSDVPHPSTVPSAPRPGNDQAQNDAQATAQPADQQQQQ